MSRQYAAEDPPEQQKEATYVEGEGEADFIETANDYDLDFATADSTRPSLSARSKAWFFPELPWGAPPVLPSIYVTYIYTHIVMYIHVHM